MLAKGQCDRALLFLQGAVTAQLERSVSKKDVTVKPEDFYLESQTYISTDLIKLSDQFNT